MATPGYQRFAFFDPALFTDSGGTGTTPTPRPGGAGWSIAKVEWLLIRRRAAWMTACGLDTAASGVNPDLAGPIAEAILHLGGTLADPVRPDDGDLATVAGREAAALELADYLLLEAIAGNQDSVTLYYGSSRAEYSDWSKRIAQELARLEPVVRRRYGYGLRPRRPRVAPLATNAAWPPGPPPPAGIGPYPPGNGPAPDASFNP